MSLEPTVPTILMTRPPKTTRTIAYTDSLDAARQIYDLRNFVACNGEYDATNGNLTINSLEGEQVVYTPQGDATESELRLRTCNILVRHGLFSSTSTAVAGTFGVCEPGEDPIRRSFQFTRSDEGTKVIPTTYVTKEQTPS
ncbi:MAG TPA: hypothetical protein VF281_01010 [Candidatus Saccharimonadales bacterium]